ncbi:DUF6094 domain-containing protein [Vallitalea guaymasensis]|uniref:DUF6094 domain-containing protein n=1 Tax=Vallitalea guaymasensis TaxID=1185412 RepID=UPI000DE276A5|nr:DUF6094 domain-containing protein [Vallitalea guaymasensis]
MEVKRQTGFQRVLYNLAKKGAYYTDSQHCNWLSKLFEWPKEEVCILEPSIGDGAAVSAVIDKNVKDKKLIFGIELDEKVYKINKHNPNIRHLINADFTNGVKISNNSFSFCFGNPPYGKDVQAEERLEFSFLKKVTKYLKPQAVLVWVIPYYVFQEEPRYAAFFSANYEVSAVYKFHDKEFKKYKQIAIIAIKRPGSQLRDNKEANKLLKRVLNIDEVQLVPIDYHGPKIKILPSLEKDIIYFSTKKFNPYEAEEALNHSAVYKELREYTRHEDVLIKDIGRPPVQLSANHMYLLAVCGCTSSYRMGTDENSDVHLQRGKVDMVEHSTFETKDNGAVVETVTSSAHTKLTIIENDGTITILD